MAPMTRHASRRRTVRSFTTAVPREEAGPRGVVRLGSLRPRGAPGRGLHRHVAPSFPVLTTP